MHRAVEAHVNVLVETRLFTTGIIKLMETNETASTLHLPFSFFNQVQHSKANPFLLLLRTLQYLMTTSFGESFVNDWTVFSRDEHNTSMSATEKTHTADWLVGSAPMPRDGEKTPTSTGSPALRPRLSARS